MSLSEAEKRAKALFDAEWDLEDDQDLTAENQEKGEEKTKEMSRDVKRNRRNTILMACQSASIDDENQKASVFPNGYQEIPLLGGGFYRGYIVNGAFDGEGEIKFANGDIYEGSFKKDLRSGYGKFITKDQTVRRGGSNAKAKFTCVRYDGCWVEDQREGGWGITRYSNGDVYEGPFHSNRPNTTFVKNISQSDSLPYTSSDPKSPFFIIDVSDTTQISDADLIHYVKCGELPEGHKLRADHHQSGAGNSSAAAKTVDAATSSITPSAGKLPTYRFADGRIYVGGFQHFTREGRGVLKAKNGDISVGNFSCNVLHGCGTIIYHQSEAKLSAAALAKLPKDGIKEPPGRAKKIVGIFKMGRKLEGRLKYTDGKIYEGQWDFQSEKPHGFGVCKMRCGDVYQGEWYYGKMQGKGRITYTGENNTGKFYDGEWFADKPHGRGTMLLPTGTMVECLWDSGKQVQPVDQDTKIAQWVAQEEANFKEFKKSGTLASALPPANTTAGATSIFSPPPFILSGERLKSAVAKWKQPLVRKTGCTEDNLPSLVWFFEGYKKMKEQCIKATELPITKLTKISPLKKASVVAFESATSDLKNTGTETEKNRSKTGNNQSSSLVKANGKERANLPAAKTRGGEDDDLDLDLDDLDIDNIAGKMKDKNVYSSSDDEESDDDDDDDDDMEIDFDAIDDALKDKKPKDFSDDDEIENVPKDDSLVECSAVIDVEWEIFSSEMRQPEEDSGPSDNEHHSYLKQLREKGFVAELLGNIDDFAESDHEEEEREKEAAREKAKDTSWFTQDPPANKSSSSAPQNTAQPSPKEAASSTKVHASSTSPASNQLSAPTDGIAISNNCEMIDNSNDCVSGAQTVAKGWMEKYSIGKSFFSKLGAGGWKRRFFTLLLLSDKGGSRGVTGALLYYDDEECNKHLGTVNLHSSTSKGKNISIEDTVLYQNPSRLNHKKADRPDLDIIIEYSEAEPNQPTKRYKLLLRASTQKEHDQWIMYFSRIIKKRQ